MHTQAHTGMLPSHKKEEILLFVATQVAPKDTAEWNQSGGHIRVSHMRMDCTADLQDTDYSGSCLGLGEIGR